MTLYGAIYLGGTRYPAVQFLAKHGPRNNMHEIGGEEVHEIDREEVQWWWLHSGARHRAPVNATVHMLST